MLILSLPEPHTEKPAPEVSSCDLVTTFPGPSVVSDPWEAPSCIYGADLDQDNTEFQVTPGSYVGWGCICLCTSSPTLF